MVLSEYEAKRAELDKKMEELNEMESEKKNRAEHQVSGRLQEDPGADRTVEAQAEGAAEAVPERQGMVPSEVQEGKSRRDQQDAHAATGIPDGERHREQGDPSGREEKRSITSKSIRL